MKKARFILALLLCMILFSSAAYAKEVKTSRVNTRGPYVRQGKTICRFHNKDDNNNYVKFKAPKSRVYTFTIKSISYDKKTKSLGFFELMDGTKEDWWMHDYMLKTKGGKTYTCRVCTDNYANKKKRKVTTDSFIKSRSASVYIEKGSLVYISLHMAKIGKGVFTLTIR